MKKPSKIGLNIAQIHQISDRLFQRKLRENDLADLNPSQGRVLFALKEQDLISMQELSDRTSLSNSTLTVVIDKLESKKLVKRVPSKKDRRKHLIKLLDKFQQDFERYFKIVLEMSSIYYEGFSPTEIDEIEENIANILKNLEKQERIGA
ncbi:MAG: MarR family transcriptional regulator [Asgard group archaeon]|nr:MarR family transcriptional regulator [Asgard group archaeon]